MTDTPQQEQVKPDADASAPQLLHPDPAEFSIITRHAVESPYVSITDSGMSKDERERVWKKLGQYENRQERMRNTLNIALSCFCVTVTFFAFFAPIISVAVFGMDALRAISWFTVGSLLPGSYYFHKKRLAVKAARKVSGTVVGYIKHLDSDSCTFYALKVEFRDKTGMKHVVTSTISSASPSKKIGEQVLVLIHADGSPPELFLFDDLYFSYCLWFFAGIIAGLFLLGPYLLNWFYPLTE